MEKHIGKAIDKILFDRNMSNKELGDLIEEKRHKVYSILKKESSDFKDIVKICHALKIGLTQFIDDEYKEIITYDKNLSNNTNESEKDYKNLYIESLEKNKALLDEFKLINEKLEKLLNQDNKKTK